MAGLLPTVIILAVYVRLPLPVLVQRQPLTSYSIPFAMPCFSFKYTTIAG